MSDKPISTRPLSDNEKLLRDKFYASIVAQSDLMDKLSERLLTLELAIPGLYATVLKLVSGDKATVILNPAFYLTFACWLAALGLTLFALIPQKWTVDTSILRQDPAKFAQEGLGIEDFFQQSAQHKRGWLIASSVLFFIGIFSAAYTIG
jgi:hypothetical protein